MSMDPPWLIGYRHGAGNRASMSRPGRTPITAIVFCVDETHIHMQITHLRVDAGHP
jgi:hypothetical protein